MRSKSAAHLVCTFAAAAILSACASKTQVSNQTESSQYLSRAGRDYAAPGPASDPWGPYVREAASRYDVPERWIREVMRQESGGHLYGRGGDLITSGAGAMGLMQVMPATYDDLRTRYRELGEDPYDPHNNILAGTAYIREMYDIYGSPGFLAAYNAGPGRLDDYLTRNRSLPEETRRYVANIGPRIAGYSPSTPSPGQQYAMNSMPLNIPAGPRYAPSVVDSEPVQVAEAPHYIRLNPPQPEPIQVAEAPHYIHLNPQPEPVQVAEAPRTIHLNPPAPEPEPVQVAEAAPTYEPSLQLSPRPAPFLPVPMRMPFRESRSLLASAHAPTRYARLPEPPVPEPARPYAAPRSQFARYVGQPASRPIEVAEFPEPPRPPHMSQQQLAAAELVPSSPRGVRFFGLIGSANAAPMRHVLSPGAPASGAWAVQVGAFGNPGTASAATASARENAREVLGYAHTVVAGVRQPGGTLYRARLTGLSRDAAAQACERLNHARTNCMVVSPNAQY